MRRFFRIMCGTLLLGLLALGLGRLWLHRALYHISDADFAKIPSQCSVSNVRFQSEIAAAQRFMKRFMIETQSPSFSVAVAYQGKLVWSEAFGYINLQHKIPATPSTRYRIHSVSKPITGMALATLYEAGLVSLDSSVQQYVPEFPAKAWPFTVRQLSAHTAGIRHYRSSEETLNTRHFGSLTEALSVFENDSLLFEPGTQVRYSSFGYNLLGRVVEKLSGQPYLEYIQRQVLQPAQAAGIGIENNDTSRVVYYERTANGTLRAVPPIDQSIKYPSGGLVGTPSDMVKFGAAYWRGGLVQPAAVAVFTEMQHLRNGAETGFGLGWELPRKLSPSRRMLMDASAALGFYLPHATGFYDSVYHRGGAVGGISGLVIYKSDDLVLAFTCNVNGDAHPPPWKLPTLFMEGFIKNVRIH